MRRRLMSLARPVAGLLVLVLALAWTAPPLAAAEGKAAAPTTRLATAAAAKIASLKPATRAFQGTGAPTGAEEPRSFLRSPAGVAAVVLMVAGAGFALYSTSHDRKAVKSPIR